MFASFILVHILASFEFSLAGSSVALDGSRIPSGLNPTQVRKPRSPLSSIHAVSGYHSLTTFRISNIRIVTLLVDTMKILMILLLPYASAFSIIASQHPRVTALEATTRRNALEIMVAAGVTFPMASRAFSQQLDDYAYEPSQQATDGKFDLNAAFVVSPWYSCVRSLFLD